MTSGSMYVITSDKNSWLVIYNINFSLQGKKNPKKYSSLQAHLVWESVRVKHNESTLSLLWNSHLSLCPPPLFHGCLHTWLLPQCLVWGFPQPFALATDKCMLTLSQCSCDFINSFLAFAALLIISSHQVLIPVIEKSPVAHGGYALHHANWRDLTKSQLHLVTWWCDLVRYQISLSYL